MLPLHKPSQNLINFSLNYLTEPEKIPSIYIITHVQTLVTSGSSVHDHNSCGSLQNKSEKLLCSIVLFCITVDNSQLDETPS